MATIDALHSTDAQQPGPETRTVIRSFEQYVVPNYRRFNVCLVRGEGSRVSGTQMDIAISTYFLAGAVTY
jgi:acetylornithine/succinyldiaminopimelate/putrescine aminotransferase